MSSQTASIVTPQTSDHESDDHILSTSMQIPQLDLGMENIVHQHSLVDNKPFPDDIYMLEAYIIPHNLKKWPVMSYQTTLIIRDKISIEGFQECCEMLGVEWSNIPSSDITTQIIIQPLCWLGTSNMARRPIMFWPHP